ncbi:hypothetical protein [Fimbriiglobus ruber]|uniref:Uncharacterized protein n=1 Tax=Fimbriiglobus ruber TaxID=1908690 RepID=A0A225DDS1_9BACT|nr:hypothetical protein [Fimbriiglobus ruber]OWK34267.1 hypothetical protein FRUB_10238 [Fimbriiglobus ruber]
MTSDPPDLTDGDMLDLLPDALLVCNCHVCGDLVSRDSERRLHGCEDVVGLLWTFTHGRPICAPCFVQANLEG